MQERKQLSSRDKMFVLCMPDEQIAFLASDSWISWLSLLNQSLLISVVNPRIILVVRRINVFSCSNNDSGV